MMTCRSMSTVLWWEHRRWPSMMIYGKWHAIAVKMGWGKIKDVVIRPGGLAIAMVIYMSQNCVIWFLYALERGCALEVLPYVMVRVSRGKVACWNIRVQDILITYWR
jgi:hypothetical protein